MWKGYIPKRKLSKDLLLLHVNRPREALGPTELEAGALAEEFVDGGSRNRDHVLPFPVLDEVQRLQRADNVLGLDSGHVAYQPDGQLPLVVTQQVQQHIRPVAAAQHGHIVEKSQIRAEGKQNIFVLHT